MVGFLNLASLVLGLIAWALLVKIEDWAALMDTTGAVALAAGVLLVVTIILNMITLLIYRQK